MLVKGATGTNSREVYCTEVFWLSVCLYIVHSIKYAAVLLWLYFVVVMWLYYQFSLHWCHNDHDDVSNHLPHRCLLNHLFRHRSKKTSKLRITGLCVGNSPGPVNSPHKGPVTRKMFLFDDVIMFWIPIMHLSVRLPGHQEQQYSEKHFIMTPKAPFTNMD